MSPTSDRYETPSKQTFKFLTPSFLKNDSKNLNAYSGILSLVDTAISLIGSGPSPFIIFCLDQLANKGSFVRQYPPTPIPGSIIFLCVGLILMASTISYKLIPASSANLDHSTINAIFIAL